MKPRVFTLKLLAALLWAGSAALAFRNGNLLPAVLFVVLVSLDATALILAYKTVVLEKEVAQWHD